MAGGEAELHCKASGFPPPKVEWIQDGRSMIHSGGRYEIEEDGRLIITDVKASNLSGLNE